MRTPTVHRSPRTTLGRSAGLVAAIAALGAAPVRGQGPEPIVYALRVPAPEAQVAVVEASIPTGGQASVELMMPVWSPGYYRIEDHAGKVRSIFARTGAGRVLEVRRSRENRWTVSTGGAPRVLVTYELECMQSSVTTNWVSAELGVFNGPATFLTLADGEPRPHEVVVEPPSTWERVATGLASAPDAGGLHFRAEDYDTLVDSPILGGALEVHEFTVRGVPHFLVDAGAPEGWEGGRVAADLARIVEESLPLWGTLPYERYVFLNVFRRGGGGLEHANSTLLTTNAERVLTDAGYGGWLSFAAHEYFHAFNVKRLRPVELGPFDYEAPPTTPSLWLSEGVTSYYGNLLLVRAGLVDLDGFLASLSSSIRQLQSSPGRLLQSVEQSSREVWTNSNSGVGAAGSTVSYYVKGLVLGFLLDAEVRRATDGNRSLDDVLRLAYERYGGARGFTPEEFRSTTEEVAGVDLDGWFRRALESVEELDYSAALRWYGLHFRDDGWNLEVRNDASPAARTHLHHLITP